MRTLFLCAATLLLCLACPTGEAQFNPGANGTMAIGASAFNKVFQAAIPLIEKIGPSLELGPFSGKNYQVGQFHLNTISVGGISISFLSPNNIQVHISDLSATVPDTDFEVFAKIFDEDFELKCKGHFDGGSSGASATVNVALSTNSHGELVATPGSSTVNVGSPDIHLHFDGFGCKVAGGIIDLFRKLIEKEVGKVVDKILPGRIKDEIGKFIGPALKKLPLKFASQPNVVNDHMDLDVQLLAPDMGFEKQGGVSSSMGPQVIPHIFNNKDVSIGISTRSFDDLVAVVAAKGSFSFSHTFAGKYNTSIFALFIPEVYLKCPDCPFGVAFEIEPYSPPTAVFGDEGMTFNFQNVVLNFTAEPSSDQRLANGALAQEISLFSAFTNLSFGLSNFTVLNDGDKALIQFEVALNDFSMHLAQSYIGQIHLSKFSAFVDGVFKDLIVPLFNSGFKGFPVELVDDGFGIDDWVVDLKQDAISLGANLLLPGQMGLIRAMLRGKL